VDLDTGTVTTIAGAFATGLAVDAGGNLFLAVPDADRILRITPGVDGIVNGGADELATTAASLSQPFDLVFGADGKAYVAQMLAGVIQKIEPGADGKLTGAPDEIIHDDRRQRPLPGQLPGRRRPRARRDHPRRARSRSMARATCSPPIRRSTTWCGGSTSTASSPIPNPIRSH
jgi:hypothetical protein